MFTPFLALALAASAPSKPAPATNTVCPVLGHAVDARSQVTTVHGHAYRLCCPACESKLQKDPGQYLEKDGTPKNAHKMDSGMAGMHHH